MIRDTVYEHVQRLKAQYEATQFALVKAQQWSQGEVCPEGFSPRDLRDALRQLEEMFVIRLFATFEGVLVSFKASQGLTLKKRSIFHLMRRIAARVQMPMDILDGADRVRESRNGVVHQGARPRITFEESKAYLNRFISYLPRTW